MTAPANADKVGRSSRGIEELLAGIDGRRPGLDPRDALRELAQRRSTEVGDVLARLAADPRRPPGLRALAARALGSRSGLEHADALREALEAREQEVVVAAARSLASVGGEQAFAALQRVKPTTASAARATEFARRLIGHRLGLEVEAGMTLEPVPLDDRRAVDLASSEPDRSALEATTRRLLDDAPMLRFPAGASLAVSCPATRFVLRLTDHATSADRLLNAPAVAGVLLAFAEGLAEFHVQEYLLTTPVDSASSRIDGVRVSGRLVHSGTLGARRGSYEYELQTVDARHTPPVRIKGVIDPRSSAITLAGSVDVQSERFRRQSRSPTRTARPDA